MPRHRLATLRLLVFFCSAAAAAAQAYFNNDRWFETATDGRLGAIGSEATITWGIATDGTTVPNVLPGVNRSSDLVASLDGWFGDAGGGSDLTQRPWFSFLESSFDRWAAVSGVTFIYEPADDGATHGLSNGVLGTRADIRLAGGRYDGTVGSNVGTLAFSIAPDNADIFLDTDDVAYYSNPSDDAFSLRHTLMHEIGHSLGLGHLISNNSAILMEPFPQTGFDGPQLDDVRGVQFLYGDAFESGGGNNTIETATPLGTLDPGTSLTLGADGDSTFFLTEADTDFLSISRSNDTDVFAFQTAVATTLEISVTPVGFSYLQQITGPAVTIDSSAVGDLSLEVRQDGVSQGVIDVNGLGNAEAIAIELAPADLYTLHIAGRGQGTQLYQLDLEVQEIPRQGDYNGDGVVDAADYTVWRDTFGSQILLDADGDGSGQIDTADYSIWNNAYGDSQSPAPTGILGIPEPGTVVLLLGHLAIASASARVSRKNAAKR
ncbi:Matrixin [Planctomycetes bacterium MalM25]|nr:Matrixin [Planctomycetes bacterium MalM25]